MNCQTSHLTGRAAIELGILYNVHNIHLLHAGEGNMKIYSPKSIIFPEGNARGEYDTRG